MLRPVLIIAIFILASIPTAPAQVQTVGAVSFAVPDGWQYKQGPDFGAMTMKADTRFWVVAVYTDMPSSGDPNADFKAAWKRVLLAGPDYRGVPNYDPYKLTETVGYPGKYYDGSSVNQTTYTRLYVLESGKTFVPVAFVSLNRNVLDSMEHNAMAVVGSVRVAPLKASPIKYSINLTDLTGNWTNGIVTSIDSYNHAGQYQSNSLTALRYGYTIAPNGSYTYKAGGLLNNQMINDDDSGVVELGAGFITFKGHRHVNQYRFVNLQQALDGSAVITLWPPVDMSQISSSRDSMYLTRPVRK
ncbi:hypothetical protein [Edaphobacter aggregans]|uniref:hypothetical protein n=1 Tax=Edaphobacter aggregans TaxID=570835 RepID=UPI000F73B3E4|nr:hypothetical protein [Edaphobacter aggregans]